MTMALRRLAISCMRLILCGKVSLEDPLMLKTNLGSQGNCLGFHVCSFVATFLYQVIRCTTCTNSGNFTHM